MASEMIINFPVHKKHNLCHMAHDHTRPYGDEALERKADPSASQVHMAQRPRTDRSPKHSRMVGVCSVRSTVGSFRKVSPKPGGDVAKVQGTEG